MVVVSRKTIASSGWRSSGFARIVSSVPGRFFFICTDAKYTSSAPAAYSWSMTDPKICGFMSSISHSSTTICSVFVWSWGWSWLCPTITRSTFGVSAGSRSPAP